MFSQRSVRTHEPPQSLRPAVNVTSGKRTSERARVPIRPPSFGLRRPLASNLGFEGRRETVVAGGDWRG